MIQPQHYFWIGQDHAPGRAHGPCMRPSRWGTAAVAALLVLAAITAGSAFETASGYAAKKALDLASASATQP